MSTTKDPSVLRLKRLRLSFPSIFKATNIKCEDDPEKKRFSAAFLLDIKRDREQIADIEEAIEAVKLEKWGKKADTIKLKGICFRSCSDVVEDRGKEMDGYDEKTMVISASAKKRFPIVDVDLTPLTSEDNRPYAGCYVNVTLRLWAQDNEFGKRVNCQIRAIQYCDKGEAFGDSTASAEDEFEDISDDEPKRKKGNIADKDAEFDDCL